MNGGYFLFIFAVLLRNPLPNAAETPPANLQLISEKFRILSRVTNAIYLQAGAIKNEINARELISELLHMPSNQLNTVVNVNVEVASSELRRMHQEYTKLIHFFENRTQSSFNDDVNAIFNNIIFILYFSRKSSLLSEVSSISTKNLLNETKSIAKDRLFNSSCSLLTGLDEFVALFDDDQLTPNSEKIAQIINEFHRQASLMTECISGLKKLDEDIDALSNWKNVEAYNKLWYVKDSIILFETFREPLSSWNESLLKILSAFQTAKPLWNSRSSLGQSKIFEAMAQLNKSIVEAEDHNISSINQDLKYTAGFKNFGDFSKIAGDLKSAWFKKFLAKGSDTRALSSALQTFQNVSEKMDALDSSWSTLMRLSEKKMHPIGLKANFVADVATIGLNLSELERVIHESGKHIESCMKPLVRTTPNSFGNQIVNYETFFFPAHSIMTRLSNVKDIIKELNTTLNFMTGSNEQLRDRFHNRNRAVYSVLDQLQVNASNSIIVKRILRRKYKGIVVNSYEFLSTIKSIAKIASELQVVQKTAENITVSDGNILGDLISNLSLVETSKCFSQYYKTMPTLESTVSKLKSLRMFPDGETISTMLEYLDLLGKVQSNLTLVEKEIKSSTSHVNSTNNPVLLLKTPQALIKNIGTSTRVLEDLENVRQHRQFLYSIRNFTADVKKVIVGENLIEWIDPEKKLRELLEEADQLNGFAGSLRNGSLTEMARVFDEAAKIKGIGGDPKSMANVSINLLQASGTDQLAASKVFRKIRELNLDFAKHEASLKSASVTVISLIAYYDEIFGNSKSKILTIEKHIDNSFPWIYILLICIGSILLIGLFCVVAYGFTKNGRAKYTNLYLYYFGKPLDYERRWRYSLFLDNQDGKNTLLDAVREINKTNVMKAVKLGSYITAYNKFGNTALHAATKSALPEIVKILIEHGADLTLLNTLNKTPEQMIPLDSPDNSKDKIEKLEKIRKLYNKANGKKYKKCVPQKFPATSFHIWMDEITDNKITNDFMEKFQAITSDEAAPNTTHVIVKTDENGVLDTDNLDLLFWMFNGAIIVKEKWMIDCLNDEKLIEQDSKYLVDSVKYKGSTFKTVLQWSEAMAKGAIPYLYGVYTAIVMKECKNLLTLNTLVAAHGGVVMDTFPGKELFNVGSRPYHHANLGPLFLIHDGTINLNVYQSDPDKMYTLFTEAEFIKFMLERNIVRDICETPINVLKDLK
ncbi:BRCT domain-containing protein [Caenorhabditis elegans]|uniref:BRCT domain-containing protein n=1 Tax=Caenorhabditis elegans TaxID=6239 RepID=Q9XV62_CAEEL|nr:BRCT domain-containing protein [Caenorhabditis elegans]CAB04180.2 BRCT domain-containing protein [Caenorhabditis elegans]|eukprot:NP_507152.2 Uncharacterized protein CELE_F26D2.10 [Caenorhabditis elegans]